jgi:hypothetical protein
MNAKKKGSKAQFDHSVSVGHGGEFTADWIAFAK